MNLIDFHCDTIFKIFNDETNLRNNNYSVDIEKLKKGNSLAQFFALFIEKNIVENPLETCLDMLDKFQTELDKNKEYICIAKNYNDLLLNKSNNKISAFLTIEEGAAIKGSLRNLRNFYRLGVRLMTLTWNFPNEIGYPNCDPQYMNKPLTKFGFKVIEEMNHLHMLIDVSHLSDAGFFNVSTQSKYPFIASHSNARAITNHPRNLTDKMIKILSEKGGVMGLNFCGLFLGSDDISRIDNMILHLKHIKNVGGIDVISIGTDFDGIDSTLEIKNIGEMDKLVSELKKNNFTEEEIEKIFYKNALRIIKDCL